MQVHYRCFHILVSQQCLHGSDIDSVLKQVRRKRMTQRMRNRPPVNPGLLQLSLQFAGKEIVADMMSAHVPRPRIDSQLPSRNQPLPAKFRIRARILPFQSMGQKNSSASV